MRSIALMVLPIFAAASLSGLMFTATLRALNGRSDGEALAWWWGETLRQHVFRPPSVFNFYPPDYPVPGKPAMVGRPPQQQRAARVMLSRPFVLSADYLLLSTRTRS